MSWRWPASDCVSGDIREGLLLLLMVAPLVCQCTCQTSCYDSLWQEDGRCYAL